MLTSYSWPGNVRELKNLTERFVVLENIEAILPEHLPHWITEKAENPSGKDDAGAFVLPDGGISMKEVEKDLMLQALKKTQNNQSQAAKLLNMTYDAFRSHMRKHKIK